MAEVVTPGNFSPPIDLCRETCSAVITISLFPQGSLSRNTYGGVTPYTAFDSSHALKVNYYAAFSSVAPGREISLGWQAAFSKGKKNQFVATWTEKDMQCNGTVIKTYGSTKDRPHHSPTHLQRCLCRWIWKITTNYKKNSLICRINMLCDSDLGTVL